MKSINFFLKLLLPLGLMAIIFQGCYTELATMREDDTSYRQEQQPVDQNDSTYYGEENDNWQPHRYVGFDYYYPGWNSCWAWDYGCVYPSYWDPWYWGPAFYIGYAYYPHHWGYWNSYSVYAGYRYRNTYSPRQFMTRNSGYVRTGNSRQSGAIRSGYAGVGTTNNGRVETSGGRVTLPRTTGSGVTQSGSVGTTRTSRNTSSSVSTMRQRGNWYSPSVQQPRHRDQSNTTINRSSRTGYSHSRQYSRSKGTNNGQSRSSQRSSTPSYSPRQSGRASSPSSAPASRNGGGGGRQSGGSGRSR